MTIIWEDLFAAFALMLILEGIFPFLFPARWREMMYRLIAQDERTLRLFGLGSMLIGTLLLFFVKN